MEKIIQLFIAIICLIILFIEYSKIGERIIDQLKNKGYFNIVEKIIFVILALIWIYLIAAFILLLTPQIFSI
jgi:hypothetical protein